MVLLELREVTVTYPGRGRILDQVSMSVPDGEIACILGPTGCGKTTTLRVISGILKPSRGQVMIDGHPAGNSNRLRVGYVFQEPRLLPWRSILGNVEFALEPVEPDREKRHRIASRSLKLVGLSGREEESPQNLSGGEMQRVSLARSLALDPSLLLMDEPFSSLDVGTRKRLLDHFVRIIEMTRRTTVFVTHDLFEAMYLADRLIVYSRPPARIKADIVIDDKRPRDLASLGMLRLRKRIVELLED